MTETDTTARLGDVQRAILAYLATAPAGFGGTLVWAPGHAELREHGEPNGVTIERIATAVYRLTAPPSPSQIRSVQRTVARLAELGLVSRWQSWLRMRARTTSLGYVATMPEPGLFVAYANWRCEHIERRDREWRQWQESREAALRKLDDVSAVRALIGGEEPQ